MKDTLKFLAKIAALLFLLLAIFQLVQEIFDVLNPNKVKEYVPIYDDEDFSDGDWNGEFDD